MINFVDAALQITAAVTTTSTVPDASLISKLIKSLARLVSRSGNNGSTQQEMFVAHDPFQAGFINISSSSSAAQVHTVMLTSQARVKNRGWGGTNKDRSRYASGYVMAAAVTNFTCNNGMAPPSPGGIWRYATTPGAPYSTATLAATAQSLFNSLGISVNTAVQQGNSWDDGCVPSTCQPHQCGHVSNGCGGSMYCGACSYCGDGLCSMSEEGWCIEDCGLIECDGKFECPHLY